MSPEDEETAFQRNINIVSLGEIWRQHPDLRDPIINGMLRRGQMGNIVATSKAYKTYMIVGLAVAVAKGAQWLDRFQCIKGRVLLVDYELQGPDITYRTRAIAQAAHLPEQDARSRIDVLSLRGKAVDIINLESALLRVTPRQYDLVVFDPLYKCYPESFDENSNAQMTKLYCRFERLAEHLDCAILIVHHGTKGNQAEKRVVDVGAGASAMSRSADAHIALREHEQDGAIVFDATIRSFAPIEPFCLRWNYPLWERAMDLDPEDLRTTRRRSRRVNSHVSAKAKADPWTVDRFVDHFVTTTPKSKATIDVEVDAIVKTKELSGRHAVALFKAALDQGKIHEWTDQNDHRKRRYSTDPQPPIQDEPDSKQYICARTPRTPRVRQKSPRREGTGRAYIKRCDHEHSDSR
jgi:hypothetical protein